MLKGTDFRRQDEVARSAAQLEDIRDVRRATQAIIESLRSQLIDVQKDRDSMWKMFRELQEAFAKCEDMHHEDTVKIRRLDQEKESLTVRVRILELRTSSITPGDTDE